MVYIYISKGGCNVRRAMGGANSQRKIEGGREGHH